MADIQARVEAMRQWLDTGHLARVAEPCLLENCFASSQPFLLNVSGAEWRLAFRARIYRAKRRSSRVTRQPLLIAPDMVTAARGC